MKYEEALKIVEKHNPESDFWSTVKEALEKQIPVKKHKYMGYRCICGKEVARDQDYCEYCGQKLLPILWSETIYKGEVK